MLHKRWFLRQVGAADSGSVAPLPRPSVNGKILNSRLPEFSLGKFLEAPAPASPLRVRRRGSSLE